jgi:hypothetical protein
MVQGLVVNLSSEGCPGMCRNVLYLDRGLEVAGIEVAKILVTVAKTRRKIASNSLKHTNIPF